MSCDGGAGEARGRGEARGKRGGGSAREDRGNRHGGTWRTRNLISLARPPRHGWGRVEAAAPGPPARGSNRSANGREICRASAWEAPGMRAWGSSRESLSPSESSEEDISGPRRRTSRLSWRGPGNLRGASRGSHHPRAPGPALERRRRERRAPDRAPAPDAQHHPGHGPVPLDPGPRRARDADPRGRHVERLLDDLARRRRTGNRRARGHARARSEQGSPGPGEPPACRRRRLGGRPGGPGRGHALRASRALRPCLPRRRPGELPDLPGAGRPEARAWRPPRGRQRGLPPLGARGLPHPGEGTPRAPQRHGAHRQGRGGRLQARVRGDIPRRDRQAPAGAARSSQTSRIRLPERPSSPGVRSSPGARKSGRPARATARLALTPARSP